VQPVICQKLVFNSLQIGKAFSAGAGKSLTKNNKIIGRYGLQKNLKLPAILF